MSAQAERWRVDTAEGIFETDLETLRHWILEGCVLPTDKVSKGKLNWIEAGKAPMLRGAFNGEVSPVTRAVAPVVSELAAEPQSSGPVVPDAAPSGSLTPAASSPTETSSVVANGGNRCHNHAAVAPEYVCRICAGTFCSECTKFVGAKKNIALCPLCGDLCHPIAKERAKFRRQEFQSAAFGFADFGQALAYPFQHKVALLCGALLYGFLLLAGFRGQVVAFVIIFGCIARVISQVAWGRFNRSFLPDFSEFSMWDDLAVPIGLGIGITIVTWGPAIVLALLFFFGVVSGPDASPTAPPNAEQPGTLTSKDLGTLVDPNADPKGLEEANKNLNQTSAAYQISQEAERSKREQNNPLADMRLVMRFLQLSLVFLPFILLSIAWAIFYFPMALTVAGYTEHFGSVVNPLVGLDTIRRMRGDYFKAFGMVLLIKIVGGVIAIILAIVLAPFALSFIGNLPASFIDGCVTFYLNLVVACVLGLALHKSADRLGIDVE